MRRIVMPAVVLMLVLAGCSSSSEPLAFDLSLPLGEGPQQLFTISGAAVDGGVVCSDGLWIDQRMETADGEPLDIEGWAEIFDGAVESGSVAEGLDHKTFTCRDGSGTFMITDHAHLDFAVLDVSTFGSGETEWGTWTLEGTGDYESLTGSGKSIASWDEGRWHFVGEIEG